MGVLECYSAVWEAKDTERVGFEPTVSCPTQHFQCCAFDHSAISPKAARFYYTP